MSCLQICPQLSALAMHPFFSLMLSIRVGGGRGEEEKGGRGEGVARVVGILVGGVVGEKCFLLF